MPNLSKWVADNAEEILLADGFEEAFMGLASRFGFNQPVAAYDYEKCIDILVTRDGMDREEAEEYFDFNVIGAWVGELPPIFVTLKDE
jgi:hypothetical protein